MGRWTDQDMREVFGKSYETLNQHQMEQALQDGRTDFRHCYLYGIHLKDLPAGSYDISFSRLSNCTFDGGYLDRVSFEQAAITGCQFQNIELFTLNLHRAGIYQCHTSNMMIHTLNAQHVSLRQGWMRNCLLGNADFTDGNIIGTDFIHMKTGTCRGLQDASISLNAATLEEAAGYRQHVLASLSEEKSLAYLDLLSESSARIWAKLYHLSAEQYDYLSWAYANETSDPETEAWRNDLSVDEQRMIDRWDKSTQGALCSIAAKIADAQQKAAERNAGKAPVIGPTQHELSQTN